MLPDTKIAPFPQFTWGVVLTAWVVFYFSATRVALQPA